MAVPTAKFIVKSDFASEPFQIAQDSKTEIDLQKRINENEYRYLRRIIGDGLYTELIADLSGSTPQHPKFLALLNGDTYTDVNGKIVIYEGMKDALKHFIWVMYIRKANYLNTISGTNRGQNENSTTLINAEITALCREAWNQGAILARAVNYFIQNFEDYSATASSIVLTSGTTYTVSITDTKYLKNGDTVTLRGTDYVISNLVNNDSFTVDSNTDISGTDQLVEWEIFGQFTEPLMEMSFLNR